MSFFNTIREDLILNIRLSISKWSVSEIRTFDRLNHVRNIFGMVLIRNLMNVRK